jgi:hypothetical protein
MEMQRVSGRLLEPRVWCRQPWCREDAGAEHWPGDGCTCDAHGRVAEPGLVAADPLPAPEPRITVLKAHASRLKAFACRACGGASRRMVEYPMMFFRCEPCAAEDRWPTYPRVSG